jgi:hypothetical protein
MKCFALWVCVGAVVWVCAGAQAEPIVLLIDPSFGSTENTGATARLVLSFSESGTDDLVQMAITNTTPLALGSALTAVGLEVPDSWAASFAPGGTSAYFDALDLDVSVSPGWLDAPGGYDLMLTSDGSFEGGNPQGAPQAGETQTVVLSLGDTGLTPTALAATFSTYYAGLQPPYAVARFQAVGPGGELSDKVGGGVPEPSTLLLLASGLGVLWRRIRTSRGV